MDDVRSHFGGEAKRFARTWKILSNNNDTEEGNQRSVHGVSKVMSTFVFMLIHSKRTFGSAKQSKGDDADKMFDDTPLASTERMNI